ncbi:MAG TPA: hypothetical protein VMP67_05215 [Candidatus Limnocylindria bacterium]|nr:hypothetical protein [Candidatus Limnocylindria bacterium]
MQATGPEGQMHPLSLRFLDAQLESEYQREAGREGRAGFVVTAGSSAVLWAIAATLLTSGTGLSAEVAVPLSLDDVPAQPGLRGGRQVGHDARSPARAALAAHVG